MLLLILQTNQNGRRVVGEGVSNYSFYALEAKAKPARVKYNLVSNQLADWIFHEIGFEAQMDYSGDCGHKLEHYQSYMRCRGDFEYLKASVINSMNYNNRDKI